MKRSGNFTTRHYEQATRTRRRCHQSSGRRHRRLPATESRILRAPCSAVGKDQITARPRRRRSLLVERQVAVLRDKNDKLESRLRELIDVARDNDVLAAKIHRLACRLLRARTAPDLIEALEGSLREDFGASEWILLLAPAKQSEFAKISSRHLRIVDALAHELKMFETLFESGRPRCGQIRDSQRDYLFGANTIEIASAALVPLGQNASAGLLAIGSPDSERFHPTMSTEFLARIGNLVSEAIAGI